MKKFVITLVNDYNYQLKDEKENIVNLNLEFVDLNQKPASNDSIFMSERLINKRESYAFGPLGGKHGKKIESLDDDDIIVLEINGEKIYLQRYYG